MADEILQNSHVNEGIITLVAEGRQFVSHKSKLIESSDYFRAMFSSNFTEHEKNTIELQGIDADCLLLLLQYVECGSYIIPSDNILMLLQTAAMLQFISVQSACEQEILASLSCDTCLEVYYVTSSLGLTQIATAALTISVWNFSEIRNKPQFFQLSLCELIEYVSNPSLYHGPGGEWTVWEALLSWIQVNEAERSGHLLQLFQCVDFHSLTIDDISNMLFYNIVSDNNEAVQVLETIKKFKMSQLNQISDQSADGKLMEQEMDDCLDELGRLKKCDSDINNVQIETDSEQQNVQVIVKRILKRARRKLSQVPCVVGFKRSQSSHRKIKAKNSDDEDEAHLWSSRIRNLEMLPVVYSFNPVTKKMAEEIALTKLCDGPVQCSGYQVCSVGPFIYIIGGEYQLGHGNWNKSLLRYSTISKKWIVEYSLPQPRRHYMVCVVDSIIYLLGGLGRHRVIQSSVDAYDTNSGEWMTCPDMPHCVGHGAACAFQGRLMVFTQEMQLLTYYPSKKKWSAIPVRSPSKQGYRAALTWKNCVYLVDNCSTLVYKFSPEEGRTITNFGRFVTPPVNVCIVDGKMYSFSHDDLDDSHVIEVLDITEKQGGAVHTSLLESKATSRQSYTSQRVGGQTEAAVVAAKEVWREKEAEPHIFTTKCPADATFSLGCFPLLKLGL
ncbi:kelch-like protein 38 isoform X2 [Procambarus clarkii]|nr:kelch-like protein 38 [Procambarus clarkii]